MVNSPKRYSSVGNCEVLLLSHIELIHEMLLGPVTSGSGLFTPDILASVNWTYTVLNTDVQF